MVSSPQISTSIDEFVMHAAKLRDGSRRAILGIAGPPGAGKSTFTRVLVKRLNEMPGYKNSVSLLPMDGYHYPNSVLEERDLMHVKGSPATFDLDSYIELLTNVRNHPQKKWFAPGFSRVADEPVINEHCITPETRLVVTEGNYLLLDGQWSAIRPLCTEIWFLDVNADTERSRLIRRQLARGKSIEAATDWADRTDLANAEMIRSQSTPADRYIQMANGAL